jgi:hypothetical protein
MAKQKLDVIGIFDLSHAVIGDQAAIDCGGVCI